MGVRKGATAGHPRCPGASATAVSNRLGTGSRPGSRHGMLGAASAAVPVAPALAARQADTCSSILRRCSGVSTSAASASAWAMRRLASIGKRHLLAAERLDCRAVDGGLRSAGRGRARARPAPCHAAAEVAHGAIGDGAQLVLLLGRGVDLDREMPDHAVGAILGGGRTERRTHEGTRPPGRTVARAPGGDRAGECGGERDRRSTASQRRPLGLRAGCGSVFGVSGEEFCSVMGSLLALRSPRRIVMTAT